MAAQSIYYYLYVFFQFIFLFFPYSCIQVWEKIKSELEGKMAQGIMDKKRIFKKYTHIYSLTFNVILYVSSKPVGFSTIFFS